MSAARRIRVLKFSLVGAIGIAVQLGTLALLVKVGVNYLWATAIAVEFAVLHNFLWHQHYTWADRGGSGLNQFLARLLRFHLSNGLVSLVGNLLLMRVARRQLALANSARQYADDHNLFCRQFFSERVLGLSGRSGE